MLPFQKINFHLLYLVNNTAPLQIWSWQIMAAHQNLTSPLKLLFFSEFILFLFSQEPLA